MSKFLLEEKRKEFLSSINFNKVDDFVFTADNIISFDVTWFDDKNNSHTNKCYRVQWNNLNGPYKGGLRFHPSVDVELFKNLAFEQTFKNILTGLPMGGAKGGSDFDPHGKSENEIKNFCYAFMDKFYPYIGEDIDIPAGDIGVGAREIRYLYERYQQITNKKDCSLTGKPLDMGGSLFRKEATGYGLCYIVNECLKRCKSASFNGKKVIISGSGNVAIYAAEKVIQLGGTVVAMSDSNNAIYDENGIDLDLVKTIKEISRDRLKTYLNSKKATLLESKEIWNIKCDIALPCATQNELDLNDAKKLIDNGCILVAEGANMPCTPEAKNLFLEKNVLFLPGKASNAGGVAVSGLEIIQNKKHERWSFEEVDDKLKSIMENIYKNISNTATKEGRENNFIFGANKYSFNKLMELYNGRKRNHGK